MVTCIWWAPLPHVVPRPCASTDDRNTLAFRWHDHNKAPTCTEPKRRPVTPTCQGGLATGLRGWGNRRCHFTKWDKEKELTRKGFGRSGDMNRTHSAVTFAVIMAGTVITTACSADAGAPPVPSTAVTLTARGGRHRARGRRGCLPALKLPSGRSVGEKRFPAVELPGRSLPGARAEQVCREVSDGELPSVSRAGIVRQGGSRNGAVRRGGSRPEVCDDGACARAVVVGPVRLEPVRSRVDMTRYG